MRKRKSVARFRPSANPASTLLSKPDTSSRRELIDDQLYDTHWVARFFGVHPVTVHAWVRKRILTPPIRVAENTTRFLGRNLRRDLEQKASGKVFVA